MEAFQLLLENCKDKLRAEPENLELIKLRGILNNAVGLYDEAISDLGRIINQFPNDISAYYVRSHSYLSKRQYDLATQDFLTALKMDEDKADIKFAKEWTEKIISATHTNEEEINNMRKILEYEKMEALINFTSP